MNKTKDINLNIANAILKVRQEHSLSQEQFSEILGVTRQAVSRWEMGVSVPNLNVLVTISEKFNISIDEMLKTNTTIAKDKEIIITSNTKRNINRGVIFLVIGIIVLIFIPFLSKWQQVNEMLVFGTAFSNSYDYIFHFPLLIFLFVALLLIGIGIYLIIKRRLS